MNSKQTFYGLTFYFPYVSECKIYLTGMTMMFLSTKILSASGVVGPLAPSAIIWTNKKAHIYLKHLSNLVLKYHIVVQNLNSDRWSS